MNLYTYIYGNINAIKTADQLYFICTVYIYYCLATSYIARVKLLSLIRISNSCSQ